MLDILIHSSLQNLGSYKGGILNAIVWGVGEGLGVFSYEQFKQVGMVHILVASGANVVFLVEAVVTILAWLTGRKKAIFLGLLIGWWYAFEAGFGPPLVRGVLFVSLRYVAVIFGRGFSWTRGLLLILFICFLSDTDLFFSDSLWLSVVAFVGIASYENSFKVCKYKVLDEFFKGLWVGAWVLPMVAIKFGSISLLSPAVSAVTFWIFEPLVLVGFFAGISSLVWPILGGFFYILAEVGLDFLLWVVSIFLNIPGGQVFVDMPGWLFIVWYAGLLVLVSSRKIR